MLVRRIDQLSQQTGQIPAFSRASFCKHFVEQPVAGCANGLDHLAARLRRDGLADPFVSPSRTAHDQVKLLELRDLAADRGVIAVDPINRESIQNEFFQMQRQLNKTVIMVSHDIDGAIKLGDRIAAFRRGQLVQYDHPDTLLARPRDEFVGAFVGQVSTLKRLLLVKAGDAATQPETARADTPLAGALQIMDDNDCRYLIVVGQDGRAQGFVTRRAARTGQGVCGDHLCEFKATVSGEDNLRIVLSKMYQFNASWMPVVDPDGRYVGEVTQDSIAEYLSSGRSRQQSGTPAIVSPASAFCLAS